MHTRVHRVIALRADSYLKSVIMLENGDLVMKTDEKKSPNRFSGTYAKTKLNEYLANLG